MSDMQATEEGMGEETYSGGYIELYPRWDRPGLQRQVTNYLKTFAFNYHPDDTQREETPMSEEHTPKVKPLPTIWRPGLASRGPNLVCSLLPSDPSALLP